MARPAAPRGAAPAAPAASVPTPAAPAASVPTPAAPAASVPRMPQPPAVPSRAPAPNMQLPPPLAALDARRQSMMALDARRQSMMGLYSARPQLSGMYSARPQLSGMNMAWPSGPMNDLRLQQSGGAPQWTQDEQAVMQWDMMEPPFNYDLPLNLEAKEEQAQDSGMYKKKIIMAAMIAILCISVVATLWLFQGKDDHPTYAPQKTETRVEPATRTKGTTKATPPSKPSLGLTCICDQTEKLSVATYDDMCSRLYVRVRYDEDSFLVKVPADAMREIESMHRRRVLFAISYYDFANDTILGYLKDQQEWTDLGGGLLNVPFSKAFGTNSVQIFVKSVGNYVRQEMIMIAIEPDEFISKFAENILQSKVAGVSIVLVVPKKGDSSCPTDGFWKDKETLNLAMMLNKRLTQPVSIATTAAVAELKYGSGGQDGCKSVKVVNELKGCKGISKQKKFMCDNKVYSAESDATLTAMASYARENGFSCALLDSEMAPLSAKYVKRSMYNLNCNATSKSGHANVINLDDA